MDIQRIYTSMAIEMYGIGKASPFDLMKSPFSGITLTTLC